MTRIFHWLFLCERWIPCQAETSVLCLHYLPEKIHCSTKDAYTSEITFLALNPCPCLAPFSGLSNVLYPVSISPIQYSFRFLQLHSFNFLLKYAQQEEPLTLITDQQFNSTTSLDQTISIRQLIKSFFSKRLKEIDWSRTLYNYIQPVEVYIWIVYIIRFRSSVVPPTIIQP